MNKPIFFLALAAAACAVPATAQDGSRLIEQMEKADRNHDGAVSREELLAYRAGQFDRVDRNGDGVLSQSDAPRIAKVRDRLNALIAGSDRNGDGRITRAEFTTGPTTAFDMADRNNDGLVTKAELNSARAAMASKAGK